MTGKYFLTSLLLFFLIKAAAQHCPWDCSGMIMFQTVSPKATIYKMDPVLVDENKIIVTDTMYGTGKETYDSCNFLLYSDFKSSRTKKIAIHHWYQYDTVYDFAGGLYFV